MNETNGVKYCIVFVFCKVYRPTFVVNIVFKQLFLKK